MRFLTLLSTFSTAISASAGHDLHATPITARAIPGHFDIASIRITHIAIYKPTKPEPVKTTDFYYTAVSRGGSSLVKRDNWISIPEHLVTIDDDPRQGGGGASIDIAPLNLDVDTTYKLGYQVDALDGRAQAESETFRLSRTEDSGPRVSSSGAASGTASRSRSVSSGDATVQPSSTSISTESSVMQVSSSATQTSIDTTSASSAPSPSSTNTSGTSGSAGGSSGGGSFKASETIDRMSARVWTLLMSLVLLAV